MCGAVILLCRRQENEEANKTLEQRREVLRVDVAKQIEAKDTKDQHDKEDQAQHVQDRREALQNLTDEPKNKRLHLLMFFAKIT